MLRLGLLLFAAAVALLAIGCGGEQAGRPTITIHYSRFTPDVLEVRVGQPVIITLRNDDPIEHEWIVGTADVHDAHRVGTEPLHEDLPTEVTIPAFTTLETTLIFAEAGEYAYICHLPGHEAYGMIGTLLVVEV